MKSRFTLRFATVQFSLFYITGAMLAFAVMVVAPGCNSQSTPPIVKVPNPTLEPTKKPRRKRQPKTSSNKPLTQLPRNADNSNLLLGMPSPAAKDPRNYLVERPQYALSYNKDNGGPNWVSWHLGAANLGDTARGDFRPDPDLPPDWQIRPNDYRGSGYDRGHVCPSGDRTSSEADNDATFYMSNMLPQTAALNQHVWKSLEDYSRQLVDEGNELYVVAGGIGSTGRIGRGKVNVPEQCWKIAVVLPAGNKDLSRINANTRVIAVLMPNQESPQIANADWTEYTSNIAQIEKVTGYDFLQSLPAAIRKKLETKVDNGKG